MGVLSLVSTCCGVVFLAGVFLPAAQLVLHLASDSELVVCIGKGKIVSAHKARELL